MFDEGLLKNYQLALKKATLKV